MKVPVLPILGMLRLPNLLIVAISQAVPYWLLLRPEIIRAGGVPALTLHQYGWLSLATVLTTLGGYVINDYFDREIDSINRPKKVVIGKYYSAGTALGGYLLIQVLISISALQLYLSMPAQHGFWALWLFPFVSLLLFFYAWQLKCTSFYGNLLVAILCGSTPVLLLIPESRPIWLASFHAPKQIQQAISLIWLYGLFSFATNLFREQIKDLEDIQGDAACSCHTLPVRKGLRFAQKMAGTSGLALLLLLLALLFYWHDRHTSPYSVAVGFSFLVLPTLLSVVLVFRAKVKAYFSWASTALKLTMFSGIFLLLPYWPSSKEEWKKQLEQLQLYSALLGEYRSPK